MKDFENKEIKVNDEVIYIQNIRTGSSSSRKCMFRGVVKEIQKNKLVIKPLYSNEFVTAEEWDVVKIFPRDVYVIEK